MGPHPIWQDLHSPGSRGLGLTNPSRRFDNISRRLGNGKSTPRPEGRKDAGHGLCFGAVPPDPRYN
ncbi:hypothetical protein PCASD_06900 [Puccinia coronata f. sp. avenae]|uniref:Uncharacterized protein n=1 Tax=Puccinia coronata f. sp. avenae TaxID=200324 RepID=A0A2N5TA04_9BASI|nr:hypothetical protein PCASD_11176 [Puccinia coronata f. sp. avenae]PLW42786.1 hypothetical protein PCASD_06900 [Puccinia coronata f. sp. avenae]